MAGSFFLLPLFLSLPSLIALNLHAAEDEEETTDEYHVRDRSIVEINCSPPF